MNQMNWSRTNNSKMLSLNKNIFYSNEPTQLFMQIWCAFTLTFGVLGNGTVLLVFLSKWRTIRWSDVFVIALAIGDLAESIQSSLVWIYNVSGWSYHSVGKCKTIWFIGCICLYSSALLLVMVSVDRYIAVKRPFEDRAANTKRMVLITGVPTIAIGIFYLFGDRVGIWNTGDDHWICFVNRTKNDYFADIALIEFIIQVVFPLVTMAILYSMMFYELRKSTNKISQYMSAAEKSRRNRSELRTSMTLLITVLSFLITITPIRLFAILDVHNVLPSQDYNTAYATLACFSMINPCMNPFLYGRLQNTFRNEIAHIIKRLKNVFVNHDYLGLCMSLNKSGNKDDLSRDLRKDRLGRQRTINTSVTDETKKSIDKEIPDAFNEEESEVDKQDKQLIDFQESVDMNITDYSFFHFSDRETDL